MDKNGGIFVPIKLVCGMASEGKVECSFRTEIWAPVFLLRGLVLKGDLVLPILQDLDLEGWRIDHPLGGPVVVTCPRCLADRDNERALQEKKP